ncbi:uncharacterized protein LOC142570759 [Dermacentor variabilis]|uniref:uncharacterized protein LOC142570759 n=1 Tax=Dermacentor variabilis TaxID=34621 RepID=UPI003F5C07B2
MASPPPAAAGTSAAPDVTPLTRRPVVAEEGGYHYRWDVAVGDTPSDLDWGDDIVKENKKLSFEKDVRVQEFDKRQASDVVVHMIRRDDTKELAVLPERPHEETLKRKKRKKKKKKKRRRRRAKYRFELGKPIKRDDDDDDDAGESSTPPPPPAESIPPLPPMGFPDGMIMVTHERSSSSSLDGPITERIRMVGSPETFNRLSSLEPPNLQQLMTVGEGAQPPGPSGPGSSGGTPTEQFNVQAIPSATGVVEMMEPGMTEQVVQAPGGPQIKIRTKTEIEMIQPEEEPPPQPRHGIEAITRQQIEEIPSPNGGEPRYSTSQENIIRRIELPGVRPGRRRSRRFYGANTRGIDISPEARVIRTTSRKVTGADGTPRIDTKVAISPPRDGYGAVAMQRAPELEAAGSSSSSDVQKEAEILNQLSMMVNSRTDRELKRLKRRRRHRARRERRRRRRDARQSRRALKDWESTGDIPFERLQEQVSPAALTMVHSQLFNPAMQPRNAGPAASVANALEQCCKMLENVADEFRMMPQPALATSRSASPRASRRRSRRKRHGQRQGSCVSTICSWLGLNEGDAEPKKRSGRRKRRRRRASSSTTGWRSSSTRGLSSTTRRSSSGSTSGSSSWTSGSWESTTRGSASTRRRSSRSSGTSRGSKEFEFITHITTVDPRKLRAGKVYRMKGADDRSSSDTVTARNSVSCYQVTAQQHRVGDWDDAESRDAAQRLREMLVERGDEGDYDDDFKRRHRRRKHGRHKRRHRRDRSWHSDGTYRCYRPAHCVRSSQSCDRAPYRFSRYTAGYDDYSQHPLSERVPSQARLAFGDAGLYQQAAAPVVVPDVQPLLAEDMLVATHNLSAPAIITTYATPVVSASTKLVTPVQRVLSATQIVDATPQYQAGAVTPSSAVISQQSLVSRATDQTYISHVPSYQTYETGAYIAPPTIPPPSVSPLPQVASVRQTQVVIQQGTDCDIPRVAPVYEQEMFLEEPALISYQTPASCAPQEWAYEGDAVVATTVEEYSSQLQDYAPVFVEQPQPQFVSGVSTYQSSTPVLVSPPQYIVYNNPCNYYGTMGSTAYPPTVASPMMANTSPLLNPLSTYTASAPVLRHMSRTYTEEEYLTDSSTTDSYSDLGAQMALRGFGAMGRLAAPASYLASTTGTLVPSTFDSRRQVPIVPTRKPAYLDQRALMPRDPQAKSSKLALGQTCRTYDRWMADQARCEVIRENRKTGYQVHIIVAFLMLLATIIGALAILSVYGRRRYMSMFLDSDEFNSTMNSPWYRYFLRSFNIKSNRSGAMQEAFGLCRTPECGREGAYIAGALNWSVNPCSDFYSFACSIPASSPDYHAADTVIVDDIKNAVLKILREERRFVDSPVSIARRLWIECMNVSALRSLKIGPLQSALKVTGLHGWPYEADEDNTISTVWNTSAKILRYFGIPTLLNVRLTKVSRTSDAVVVLDKSSAFGSLDDFSNNNSVSERSRILHNLMRLVSPKAPRGLADEALEFVHYVLRLTESSSSKDSEEQVRSLGDLSLFQPFVLNALGDALDNITGEPVLLLQSSEYINDLIEAIRVTPPHVTLNYLGYTLVDDIKPFVLPPSWDAPSRDKVCLEALDKALPRMVHYMAYTRFKTTLENVAIRNIIDDLKHELMTAIAKTTWLDVSTKSQLLKRLTETQIHAFFPHWMSNSQVAREFFADLPEVTPGRALESYQAIREHTFRTSMLDHFDKNDLWKGSVFDTDCSVDRELNNAYFPVTLVNVTGRATQFFLLFQIPRIGSRLVRCLFLTLLEGSVYGGGSLRYEGGGASWWSQTARQSYQARKHCFSSQRPEICDTVENTGDAVARRRHQALLGEIAEAAAVAPVLKLYRMYIMSRSRHRTDYRFQNAEGVSTNQLFYVYHALNLCQPRTLLERSSRDVAGMCNEPSRRRVNSALMNDPEFEKVFGCSPGTSMNPATKCSFY